MAGGYSRIVEFDATANVATCVELPTVPRGLIRRLVLKEVTSTSAAGDFYLLDRKGACTNATDINVEQSGAVNGVANEGGSAKITFSASTELKVGDQIDIKNNSVPAYNTRHTIVSVVSPTVVVTDISYTSAGTGGLWQTKPFMDLMNPAMHRVYAGSVVSGSFADYDLYIGFENADNQSETLRMRNQALWLEFTADKNSTFQAAITTEMDALL